MQTIRFQLFLFALIVVNLLRDMDMDQTLKERFWTIIKSVLGTKLVFKYFPR